MENYISAAQINLSDDFPLFRAFATPRSKVGSQGISYTRELVEDALRDFTDVSKKSVHSLRAGEAICAANAGIPDGLFKRHGRWASVNAKDGYVKYVFYSGHTVAKSLGILLFLFVS